MKNKILLVLPFFGKKHAYFDYFLQSIANQPFNLLLITDFEKLNVPKNVFVQKNSFETFVQRISTALGQQCEIRYPYKLCDYRPAWGVIFSQELKNYDFWGSIDPDVILGNFSKIISDDLLDRIDVYSCGERRIHGAFFLVRNNTLCNTLYQKSKDWHKVMQEQEFLGFDEIGVTGVYIDETGSNIFNEIDEKGKSVLEFTTPIESFSQLILKNNKIRILFENSILEPKNGIVKADNHLIEYQGKEYLLLHLFYLKWFHCFYHDTVFPYPYYINSLGSFKTKPNYITCFFSVNLWINLQGKIIRKLRKIKSKGRSIFLKFTKKLNIKII